MSNHKIAHESEDDTQPLHCPFCGSGQTVGGSDGSIHCDWCQRSFTVRMQPNYPAMPQQPGMQNAGAPPIPDGSQLAGETPMPPDAGMDPSGQPGADMGQGQQPDANAAEGDTGSQGSPDLPYGVPPEVRNLSFSTKAGATLQFDDYLDHLAIQFADPVQRARVIATIRARRE